MQLGQVPGSYPGVPPAGQSGALPGYMQEPTTGPGDDLAGAAASEAFRFIGRRVGRRLQQTAGQAQSAAAARNEEVLRTQIAIADKYPELRACLKDSVIFLAGGQRVLPMPNLSALTMQQADSMAATLRNG